MSEILDNTWSVLIVVAGIIVIIHIISKLISNGKLNVKSDKFSIESAKKNTKSLLAECRCSCSLMAYEYAQRWIDKFPKDEYQIRYTCELALNRLEDMLHYNNVSMDKDYIEMRFTDVKSIIDRNKVPNGPYDEQFYKELHELFVKIVKQILLIKKHYKDVD